MRPTREAVMSETFRADSYKFLPRSFRPEFEAVPDQPGLEAPPARPAVPLREAKVALLTSAGLYLKDRQPPFDLDRERREPWWGDPTDRIIPPAAGTCPCWPVQSRRPGSRP